MSLYQLYGLRLRSHCPLPGIIAASAVEPPDVYFEMIEGSSAIVPEAVHWEAQPCFQTQGRFRQQAWKSVGEGGTFWRLWYRDEVARGSGDFILDPAGRHIWAARLEPATVQDMTTLLAGTVFSALLRLRGIVSLHASVVAIVSAGGPRVVVILGDHGMGKSTTAAILAQRGHAILSDDLAAITPGITSDGTGPDNKWIVHPGYARLRLWPATIEALHGPAGELTPVITAQEKRYVELSLDDNATAWRFQAQPLPLSAIYLLTRQPGLVAPRIHPLSAAARFMTLVKHTSMPFLSLDQDQQAGEFKQLSRLAASVPIRQIHCPEGLEFLPALCEAIVADQSALDESALDQSSPDQAFQDQSGVADATNACRVA